MSAFAWISRSLYPACVEAWWEAWLSFWECIGDTRDPDYQRDLRSVDRNDDIHAIDAGGNFYAAGCGSDGD